MATEVVKIVDTGGGGDYSSLAAWEAGEQRDLVTADEIAVADCRCTTGAADTDPVTIDGWTTDDTRHIKIWTDPDQGYRHDGKWNDTKYRIISSAERTLEILEDYVVVEGIQVYNNKTANHIYGICVVNQSTGKVRIDKSIVKIDGSSETAYNNGNIFCWYANVVDIINCIVYGGDKTNNKRNGIFSRDTTVNVYNCTVSGAYGGIQRYTSGVVKAINCAVFDNVDNFIGGFDTIDHCASDDGDGANAVTPSDWSSVFEDYPNGDFHLKSTDTDLRDAGVDLSSEGFTDDIDGETRSGTWDIGADEYVAAGGTTITIENGVITATPQGLKANLTIPINNRSISLQPEELGVFISTVIQILRGQTTLSGKAFRVNENLLLGKGNILTEGKLLTVFSVEAISIAKASINVFRQTLKINLSVILSKGNILVSPKEITTNIKENILITKSNILTSGKNLVIKETLQLAHAIITLTGRSLSIAGEIARRIISSLGYIKKKLR